MACLLRINHVESLRVCNLRARFKPRCLTYLRWFGAALVWFSLLDGICGGLPAVAEPGAARTMGAEAGESWRLHRGLCLVRSVSGRASWLHIFLQPAEGRVGNIGT